MFYLYGNIPYCEDFEHGRSPALYSLAKPDVLLMCFNIGHGPIALTKIENKWYPEVKNLFPGVPIVLVGTRVDKRYDAKKKKKLSDKNMAPVRREEGIILAMQLGAVGYFECIPNIRHGIAQIIQAAARTVMQMPLEKSMFYTI